MKRGSEVIAMLRWLKENGKDSGEPISEYDLDYFTRLASMYFEEDIKVKIEVIQAIEEQLEDNESICTDCNIKTDDEKETKWNLYAEPFCRKCFMKEEK